MSGVAGAGPPAEAPHAAPANAGTTIGVLYFDYAGKNAELAPLSKGLAQMLISDLAAVDTVRVVERERLQAVLDEQKLGESWKKSGKIDSRTAARIGKLLGARYLVLGTYFDAMGAFRADARLVDVETGQIVKSIGANGKAEDFIALEQLLADGLCKAAAQLPPPRRQRARRAQGSRAAGRRARRRQTAGAPDPQAAARAQSVDRGELRQGAGGGRRRRSQAGAVAVQVGPGRPARLRARAARSRQADSVALAADHSRHCAAACAWPSALARQKASFEAFGSCGAQRAAELEPALGAVGGVHDLLPEIGVRGGDVAGAAVGLGADQEHVGIGRLRACDLVERRHAPHSHRRGEARAAPG